MNIDKIESKALKVGILISFLMAIAGWITYYFTGSDAMLLDGNFSLISVFAGVVAIIISKRKHNKTKTFPFGSYVYEALFVLVKGVLILGVILVSGLQNIIKITAYIKGKQIDAVVIEPILIYVSIISVLCFFLFVFYKQQNKAIGNKSSILHIETKAVLIDGFMSLGIGVVFLLIWLLPTESSINFLKSIGDAIIVLVMCVVFFTIPLKIIKESFIELGGGIMQDRVTKELTEKAVINLLPPNFIEQGIYVSKLGSSNFILVYLSSENNIIELEIVNVLRNRIKESLSKILTNVQLEIIINYD
jgi:predicted Co/Zn/Cd cation transporter (cation efflux family)